jgi:hypothetical protein
VKTAFKGAIQNFEILLSISDDPATIGEIHKQDQFENIAGE